jgi:hypothetical protein
MIGLTGFVFAVEKKPKFFINWMYDAGCFRSAAVNFVTPQKGRNISAMTVTTPREMPARIPGFCTRVRWCFDDDCVSTRLVPGCMLNRNVFLRRERSQAMSSLLSLYPDELLT